MNQVLGTRAGNAIEMIETVKYLTGKEQEPRLHKVVQTLASAMLVNSGLALNNNEALGKIKVALNSGKAAEIFAKMIAALGGPTNFIENPWGAMSKANVITEVKATQQG